MGWSPKSIRFSTASWLVALLVSCPSPARAVVALERAVHVTPGATCLRSETLVEEIARRLGSSQLGAGLSIEVRGSPNFRRYVEFVVTQAGATSTQRRFEPGPEDCEDLHAALGLAIALTIKASQREVQDALPATGWSSASRGPWQLAAGALVGLVVAPGAGGGAGLHVQRRFAGRFAARLGVLGIANPQRRFAHSPGSFDVWLVSGRADACALPGLWARATLTTCVGFAFGGVHARGHSFEPSARASRRLLALAGAVEVAFALRRTWSLSLALSVLVPLEPTRFVVRDAAGAVVDRRQLSPVGGFMSLGPTYDF